MARRTMNLRDMRAAYDAAEALGLNKAPAERKPRAEPKPKPRPEPAARMRVVWAVCDLAGRTVQTFDYADKPAAEARAAELKAKTKDPHFVRSVKEMMG